MKKKMFVGVAVAAALALSACAGGSATTQKPAADGGGELIAAKVGVIPIVDTAPLWLGKEKGFFEEEGIDLTIEVTTGGAAAVPGVVSGDFQFAFGNLISVMVAQEQGLDIKYVANGASANGEVGKGFGAVVVRGDSDIKSAADLAGKTVSSNNLANINTATISHVVNEADADASTVKFVEIAFPDVAAALENNQVDAAMVMEPFLSSVIADGARVVTWNYEETHPELDIAGYFATGDVIEGQADLVQKFTRAMNKSLEYAQEHPDEVRDIVGTYTKIGEDLRAVMALPTYRAAFNTDAAEVLGKAAVVAGALKSAPDLKRLFP
ncbi:MAG: nitrate transporter substrate-binding protein [Homoserinimonas sp.]|jgi:NitT/TauT family transport system substrate-binding protein|nr:nitrate transporter substrate-binding protein [Homoserinimonas sp.]